MAGADDLAALQQRARAALELVHDPAVEAIKNADLGHLGPGGAEGLRQQCVRLLKHCWDLVEKAHGVRAGTEFFAVHRPGDRLNCLTLTPSEAEAGAIQRLWTRDVVVTCVTPVDVFPERWIALAVALQWVGGPGGPGGPGGDKKN